MIVRGGTSCRIRGFCGGDICENVGCGGFDSSKLYTFDVAYVA